MLKGPFKNLDFTPLAETLVVVVVVFLVGQNRWQSFVHPNLMPGLVAKAVSCLEHMKNPTFQSCANMFVAVP